MKSKIKRITRSKVISDWQLIFAGKKTDTNNASSNANEIIEKEEDCAHNDAAKRRVRKLKNPLASKANVDIPLISRAIQIKVNNKTHNDDNDHRSKWKRKHENGQRTLTTDNRFKTKISVKSSAPTNEFLMNKIVLPLREVWKITNCVGSFVRIWIINVRTSVRLFYEQTNRNI